MRFDSSQWYAQDSADPRPVRGRSFLLLCETRGSPQPLPSIAWYRDGRPLCNGRHFYIIVSINFAKLTFRRLLTCDAKGEIRPSVQMIIGVIMGVIIG